MSNEEKIRIKSKTGNDIVGILQSPATLPLPPAQASLKPIVLIIHGILAHKNQIYHKRLADALVNERHLPSFRYDLRAQGGETEGKWEQANFYDDVADLEEVVEYLKGRGYFVHSVIGHSRGAIISFLYLCQRPHSIKYFVNVSGRHNHARFRENKVYQEAFKKYGYYDWKVKVAGKEITRRIIPEGVEAFASWNNDFIENDFPQSMDVLNIHGEADKTVPVEDAHTFHRILSKRSPGTSTLVTVPDAGHNWVRPFDQPVNGIMEWLGKVDPPKSPRSKL
ncbi:alpha/beta-hydrolase [Meredithblackwellia eburnea MCA 4105]